MKVTIALVVLAVEIVVSCSSYLLDVVVVAVVVAALNSGIVNFTWYYFVLVGATTTWSTV